MIDLDLYALCEGYGKKVLRQEQEGRGVEGRKREGDMKIERGRPGGGGGVKIERVDIGGERAGGERG